MFYQDFDHAAVLRHDIVSIVCEDWDVYRLYTDKGGNKPYETAQFYGKLSLL